MLSLRKMILNYFSIFKFIRQICAGFFKVPVEGNLIEQNNLNASKESGRKNDD